MKDQTIAPERHGKFQDREVTADGHVRASVSLKNPRTLWFNTGTLCNITCPNCYIESSPTNDKLAYLRLADVQDFLRQIVERRWPVAEIGFTGGEPFMNPEMIAMAEACLEAGLDVLVLTNAMQPMMRPRVQAGLADLNARFPGKLTLRVSLDHYAADLHDEERGAGAFERSLQGMRWLARHGIAMTVAGRTMWNEPEAEARAGYRALYASEGFDIDADDPAQTVLFPEMDESADVPEITTACWSILGRSPDEVMCASSRMVVRHRGAESASVVACTLIPYDADFQMGTTLAEAEAPVALNHPHCARFCVLGGASCRA